MVNIIITTHGEVGEGVISTVRLFTGEQNRLNHLSIGNGSDMAEFEEQLRQLIIENDDGSGTLIMCDLFGGSPCTSDIRVIAELKGKHDVRLLSGVNVPMLLQAVLGRGSDMNLTDLYESSYEASHEGIKMVDKLIFGKGGI